MEKIYVVGTGGFAREVIWLIEEINKENLKYEIIGYIDENIDNIGKEINGYKVLGNIDFLNKIEEKVSVILAIGTGSVRAKLEKEIKNKKFPILIHPSVMMSKYVDIEEGTIICAGNIITTNIKIGKHVIINLDCTVGHDVILNDYSTILPGVHISGNVEIGKETSMGTSSSVIQGKNIGEKVIIGAGSVVVSNIENGCTAVGVPAKVIKINK